MKKIRPICGICGCKRTLICESYEMKIVQSELFEKRGVPLDMRGFCNSIRTLHYCPHCHLIAPRSQFIKFDMEKFLEIGDSADFKNWLTDKNLPLAARIFMGYYVIALRTERFNYAGIAALNAAWICDDTHGTEKYRQVCRELAAESLSKYVKKMKNRGLNSAYYIKIIDSYRRAGNFEKATEYLYISLREEIADKTNRQYIAEYLTGERIDLPESLSKTLMFEHCRCAERDSGLYYFEDIPKDISKQFLKYYLL